MISVYSEKRRKLTDALYGQDVNCLGYRGTQTANCPCAKELAIESQIYTAVPDRVQDVPTLPKHSL